MKFLVLLNRQIDDGDDDNDYFQELTELVSELTINPLHTIGAPSSTRKPIDILRSENIIYDKRDECFIIDITLNTIS